MGGAKTPDIQWAALQELEGPMAGEETTLGKPKMENGGDTWSQREIDEWMKANPMKGDPFEGLIFDDD